MDVLHVIHQFPPESRGGSESYACDVAQRQRARGMQVEVLTGTKHAAEHVTLVTGDLDGLPVHRLHRNDLFFDHHVKMWHPEVEARFEQFLRERKPALVHVHHWVRLTCNLVEICTRVGIPAVVTLHDLAAIHVPETLPAKVLWSLLPFLERTVERADAIVAVSHATAEEVATAWPAAAAKMEVIWNGVDAAFRPAPEAEIAATRARLDAPDGYLLYAGTLEPRKNVELLLDAWVALARARGADSLPPLLVAGPYGWKGRGLERRIEAMAELGVRRLGRLERADLVAAIQAATLFVYPSYYEGFGLPPAEAMACGVPVIVADRSSLPEIVGDAGRLVDPDDPDDLAGAIAELLDSPDLAADLGRRGVERAAAFSWASAAERLADLFERVLSEAR
ncbi:MAG: glycosyltransferase family 4 protein [Acidobacteria bacterium]|nr:glycosyltransferase family 4 protein [Acidobacteriota bacterium]